MTVDMPRRQHSAERKMSGNGNGDSKSSNVKVVVRIRPENTAEKEGPFQIVVRDMNEHVLAFDPKEESSSPVRGFRRQPRDIRKRRNKDLKFAFDYVFGPCSSNTDVYEQTTKTILDGLLEGYNCSVFAYGATGAGKTHTMLGSETSPGVMYHTMIDLYQRISNMKDEKTCDIAVSYLEVYNEQIRDLLLPRGSLPIREDPKSGVLIPGLSLHKPKNAEELLYMLQFGNKNRSQHPTDANAESSRSHAVFQVFVRQKDRTANISAEVKVAKMCLVDLAGSERATVTKNRGTRFREGANINRSLLALGNVINALSENKSKGHIPYRDSKLTRLLKDSLGGNCRTVMIAAVSPSNMSYEDTYNTLKYADRAKHIKATLKKNILSVDFHISRYGQIVEDLRREISELKLRLQKYEEGKMAASRRKSSVSEENRLKAILENIFEFRLEIRREQLRLECTYRDVQWKIIRKQRCLHRLRVISNSDQHEVCERAERGLKSLYSKLESVAKKKEAEAVKLAANQDWLNRVHSEMMMAGGDNCIPEVLDVGLRMHHLEVDVCDARQHTKHLQKLAKAQERDSSASERLITGLLQLVRKQHFILKGHNLATSDLLEEFQSVSELVEGRDVTWEDESVEADTPVPIGEIINIPLLHSVEVKVPVAGHHTRQRHTSGGAQRVVIGAASVGEAGRMVNGSLHFASDSTQTSDNQEMDTASQSSTAGHTPACKKFVTLHTGDGSTGEKVPQQSVEGSWSRLNDTFSRSAEPDTTGAQLNDTFTKTVPVVAASSNPSQNSSSMDSTFTLEAPHLPTLPQVDVPAGTKPVSTAESSQAGSCLSSAISPVISKPYVPKIGFEYVCQSPLSRSSVVRQSNELLDENSPFRRTVCLPRDTKPLPEHFASPIPVPPSVQAYMSSQTSVDEQADNVPPKCNILAETQNIVQSKATANQNPGLNLHGSSTITKSYPKTYPHLHGSSTVTKSQPSSFPFSGGDTVTTFDKENVHENASSDQKKSSVKRAITFGGSGDSPERSDIKSYAEALKTPSPARFPLKPLENNTPMSSPFQPVCNNKSNQASRQLVENRIYKSSHKSEDNARILSQYGLPSMASRTAPRPASSKPSYMKPTKAVSLRCRQLFNKVSSKEEPNSMMTAKRVVAETQPANKSLSRMRSKSMSHLNGRSRWQH